MYLNMESLILALEQKSDISEIPNIAYVSGGVIKETQTNVALQHPPIPEESIPKMSDVEANKDPEEDKTYEEMGKLMDNVTEIFGGSDRS